MVGGGVSEAVSPRNSIKRDRSYEPGNQHGEPHESSADPTPRSRGVDVSLFDSRVELDSGQSTPMSPQSAAHGWQRVDGVPPGPASADAPQDEATS